MDTKDISVIVQGAINKNETIKCLQSIRHYLPGAEIILSTWEGSNITDLDYDNLILSKDPGAAIIEKSAQKVVYNNINRQLLSTQAGLEKASRRYAMKVRSDLILTSDRFLDYFDKFQARTDNYTLFNRKIIVPALFTRFNIKCDNLYERVKIPFHVSDWWLFGLRGDLNTYFSNTKLAEEPYFTEYFTKEENKHKNTPYGKTKFKFSPEQYFGYSCFARNFKDIYMEDAADYSDELMEKFRECLVNNFIVLEFAQSGIYLNKYPYSKNEKFSGDQYIGLYNFYRYEFEYKRICDKNYQMTSRRQKIFEDENFGYNLLRIYKHISKLLEPSANFLQKLEQIFIGIPFSLISFLFKYRK
ncbi:MAG: hypothetical protein BHW62_03155 [Acinetobacter sp. CAG:196_36_41]|nr:MAG: hypothetical protein BHW62_03155 [Acinetobacter sp. CAG:196_36_41]